jgi:hypothetical protein
MINKFLLSILLSFGIQTTLLAMGHGESEEVVNMDEEEDILAEEDEELFEKVGFLTVEDCALKGTFTSCYEDSYACGFEGCYKEIEPGVTRPVQVVLFVHNDGKYYNVVLTEGLHMSEVDKGIGRNEVTVIGKYDEKTNTIYATKFKAPPPPKASFFKGCL